MHARRIIQKLLEDGCPGVHAKRANSLATMVQAALGGGLSLMGLSRHLASAAPIRHRIKRCDRLLGNSISKPFTQAGVTKIYAGEEVEDLFGTKRGDERVPDVVGIAQQGVVWAGGNAHQDRHVPIVVWGAGIAHQSNDDHVETTQIAPTILSLLALDPRELRAVQIERTKALPDLH